ncbi:hypothetical protein U1Q18_003246, partial [Sarracenia purpurea var. burkii]
DPSHAPVCIEGSIKHVEESGNVVLVWEAVWPAILPEDGVVLFVGDDSNGQTPVNFEPLRAFSPIGKPYFGSHSPAVPAATIAGGIVVRIDEAVGGLNEVFVDGREVVNRDAALREENKPLI